MRAWFANLPRLSAVSLAVCVFGVQAQATAGLSRPWQLASSASVSVSHLSNGGVLAQPTAGASQSRETVLQFSPAVSVLARSAAVAGSLSYSASALQYAQAEEANRIAHNVQGSGTWRVADDNLTVDASVSHGEQARSAFGAPVQGLLIPTANRVQVSNASISPQFKANLLQSADLTVRYTHSISESSRLAFSEPGQPTLPGLGRLTTDTLAVDLTGGRSHLRWGARLRDSTRGFSMGRSIENRSADLDFSLAVDADLRLRAGVGQEENNVFAPSLQRYNTWMVGARWTPTPRTDLDAQYNDRFFGAGHRVALQHRMSRLLMRVSDARQLANQLGGGFANPGEPVTLLEALLRSNVLPQVGEVDPGLSREGQILDGLRRAGIDPSQSVTPGSLNATPSAVRSQELFLGYSGRRLNLSVTAFGRETQRLGSPLNPFEDLALVPRFRQQGLTAAAGWRLSPTSQVAITANAIRTPARPNLPAISQQSVGLNYSTALGQRASVSLSVQQFEFTSRNGAVDTTRQSQVVTAALNMRF